MPLPSLRESLTPLFSTEPTIRNATLCDQDQQISMCEGCQEAGESDIGREAVILEAPWIFPSFLFWHHTMVYTYVDEVVLWWWWWCPVEREDGSCSFGATGAHKNSRSVVATQNPTHQEPASQHMDKKKGAVANDTARYRAGNKSRDWTVVRAAKGRDNNVGHTGCLQGLFPDGKLAQSQVARRASPGCRRCLIAGQTSDRVWRVHRRSMRGAKGRAQEKAGTVILYCTNHKTRQREVQEDLVGHGYREWTVLYVYVPTAGLFVT